VNSSVRLHENVLRKEFCRLVLAWTKEGITYALALEADWWPRMEEQLESDRFEKRVIVLFSRLRKGTEPRKLMLCGSTHVHVE